MHRTARPLLATHLVLVLVLACAACDGAAPVPDASAPDGAAAREPLPPAPPTAPALPALTPCPAGWSVATIAGVEACEPFGGVDAARCGAEDVLVPGGSGRCEPALACPAGAWPDDSPADAVYVRAGATGGDGSPDRPLGTLAEAVSLASASGRALVLGEGELTGGVQIRNIPAIVGLCPARTRIVDAVTTNSAALIVRAGTVTIRGVHLTGALYGLWLTSGALATVDGVVAEGPSSAIRLDGGATLEATRARAESPSTNDLTDPTLRLGPGATATLRSSTLVGGGSLAYGYRRAADPDDAHATLTLEDSALLDAPIGVAGRLDATLRRCAIERVGVGVVTISPRTTVLEDVRARSVAEAAGPDGAFIQGAGGTTELHRVVVSGVARGAAILALGSLAPDAVVTGEDVVVDDVAGDAAVHAEEGGSLTLRRVVIDRARGTAIQAGGGGRAMIEDATLTTSGTGSDGTHGSAVAGRDEGTHVDVVRAVARPRGYALALVGGAGGAVSDLDVEGGLGLGVQCDPGAGCVERAELLSIERARARGLERYGLAVIGARASARDLDVDGVSAPGSAAAPGLGVVAYAGSLAIERLRVRAVEGIAVIALGGSIEGHEVVVEDTALRDCSECASGTLGDGISCAYEGELRLSQLEVRGSARAGLSAARGCSPPTLDTGRIERNGIGILTDESIDPTLFRSLLVRDNGTDYDRRSLSLGASEVGLSGSAL